MHRGPYTGTRLDRERRGSLHPAANCRQSSDSWLSSWGSPAVRSDPLPTDVRPREEKERVPYSVKPCCKANAALPRAAIIATQP